MPLTPYQEIDVDQVKQSLHRLLQAGARLYMHLTNETLARFGQAGEMTVRRHLRDYGKWRAAEMREAHNALGMEINMETLIRCWDSASVFIVKDRMEEEGKYTPYDVIFDVHYCPAAEAWKEAGFHRWGHVFCDEFHQACASSYHPDGNVVIPINMMKGDDHCHFRWLMPPGAREIDYEPPSALGSKLARFYRADSPERGAYDALMRTSRLLAGRYWTFAEAIRAAHPPAEAEACIRDALRAWALQRGTLLREAHEHDGVEPNAANLFLEMDLMPRYLWDVTEHVSLPDHYEAVIDWTPLDDAWRDLNATADARAFWRETMPWLARGYDARLDASVPALAWDGDPETRVVIRRAEADVT
jgi:hypothetical protein